MNWPHMHLIINHFPVVGFLFGLLFVLYAMIRKSEELQKTSLGFLVLVAVITVPVYFTGDQAGDIMERLPDVSRSLVEQHEEAASVSLMGVLILGLIAAGGLFFFRRAATMPRWFMVLTLILAIAVNSLIGYTANLGGQIRHPEARKGFQLPN
ncbi:MAG TPA: hypothetical protein VI956_02400 [Nitrospirota bacterium]|nr:hypothetical protein [Nitrospirota bacterium]